jgi:hypothetical protein
MCVGNLCELGLIAGIMIVIIMFSVEHVAYGFLQKIEFGFVLQWISNSIFLQRIGFEAVITMNL